MRQVISELEPHCPKCRAEKPYKWGVKDGVQRYRCKACKPTFNALTGTQFAKLRKKALWTSYAEGMLPAR